MVSIHRFRRFFIYTIIGSSTFGIDLILLYGLTTHLNIPYYYSTPVAFLIAVSLNYVISRTTIFKKTERTWHGGYTYFISVALAGSFLTTSLVVLLVTYAGLYYIVARTLVAGIIGIGNYLFNVHVNFKVSIH